MLYLPGSLFSTQAGLSPLHDGVRGRWRIDVRIALASMKPRKAWIDLADAAVPAAARDPSRSARA
jgi:hypothetical protein